jgi:hypothetical protein
VTASLLLLGALHFLRGSWLVQVTKFATDISIATFYGYM